MKKNIIFVIASFILAACSFTPIYQKQNFKTDLNKIQVEYDKGFVYKELPVDSIMHEKIQKRTLPVDSGDAARDVNYILQTFFYENGRENRDEAIGMSEEQMIDYIFPEMIAALKLDLKDIPEIYTVPVFEETINPRDIYAQNIKSIIDAKQTANQYEVIEVKSFQKSGKVTAKIKKRTMDSYQYFARATWRSDYDKFEELNKIAQTKDDIVEKAIINAFVSNKLTYSEDKTKLIVIPLNHYTRTREVEIEFEYDKDGYLRLTKKGLIELIS